MAEIRMQQARLSETFDTHYLIDLTNCPSYTPPEHKQEPINHRAHLNGFH